MSAIPTSAAAPSSVSTDSRTLPSTVAAQLRQMITEGQLAPAARLNERELCDVLGVSRTPLREAFRLLAAQGLVHIEPNRGAQVIAMSEQDIRESFEVIGALEALAGKAACERATDAEIAEIRALTFEMMASHARQDLPAYYKANSGIHNLLKQASHNALLGQLYDTLNLRIQNLRFHSNENREKWDQAMREHIDMVEALTARDGVRLAAIMHAHLQRKCTAAIEAMRAQAPLATGTN
ncbi:GntR family transcriptional regulator [Alcaligenaceae bacterium A4P071]|nr:GntR family transcriptional regulator [Alcaligenaceae bacterium B3P038]MDQ2186892.1 GntR family transcriptional regulator [Alcaligenaceae bacterium A4P071]